ncbi:MAG: DNA polymerase III subunit gamma/tau, partial [Candidatus Aminicenantes bacterium]
MEEKHYRILALKYRPQTFEEVVGQKHVVQTLVNALRKGKIGQAYLFSGMRGVGKTTVARILAKALNCVHGPTPHPCNKCEFCRAIMNDRAIDVLEIDGAASRKVEEARELREGLKYSPLHSRYKVVIIDEVHMLTPEAFATLLKILEEPPPKTVFIFATTEAHKVPKTIISRCQHFEFNRISQKDIVHHLEYIAQKENLSVSREGLYLIAEAAEGSLRDAESILDKAAAFSGDNISDEDIKILLGT